MLKYKIWFANFIYLILDEIYDEHEKIQILDRYDKLLVMV